MFSMRGIVAPSISVINLAERLQPSVFSLFIFYLFFSQKPKTFHRNPKVDTLASPVLIPPTSLTAGRAPLGRRGGPLFWCFQLCEGMGAL